MKCYKNNGIYKSQINKTEAYRIKHSKIEHNKIETSPEWNIKVANKNTTEA